MIIIEKIENRFNKYVQNYDPTNARIRLKIEHIKRVAENSKIIAQNLNLSEEQISLATAIGYFHDIGRFEQVRIADTFSDRESGINHGELGAEILFKNNFIREFIEDSKYDEIIKKAVINHNRPKIENNLTEEELLFCKIIRDADKLDIFYTISNEKYSMESIFWYPNFDNEKISKEIIDEFQKKITINYSKIHNNADVIVIFYAYIYDLYFPITKKLLYENKYFEKFTNRIFETFNSKIIHEQANELLKTTLDYLKITFY